MQLDSGFRSTLALAFTHANTATKKAYLKDWAIFTAASGITSLPVSAEIIARFIGGQRSLGLSAGTLLRRLAAICLVHIYFTGESPTDSPLVGRIRQDLQHCQVAVSPHALSLTDVRRMLSSQDSPAVGLRNRAMITMQWETQQRATELVQLQWGDRMLMSVVVTKALHRWNIGAGRPAEGPVFVRIRKNNTVTTDPLSGHGWGRIIKAIARQSGIDPTLVSGNTLCQVQRESLIA